MQYRVVERVRKVLGNERVDIWMWEVFAVSLSLLVFVFGVWPFRLPGMRLCFSASAMPRFKSIRDRHFQTYAPF